MTYKIRKANKTDAKVIAALGIQVWMDTYAYDGIKKIFADYIFDRFEIKTWESLAEYSNNLILIAESDEGICGFLRSNLNKICPVDSSLSVELDPIYVIPNKKGSGIGRLLLDQLKKELDLRSIKNYWLTVWVGNEKAQRFYEYLGFKIIGEKQHGYKIHQPADGPTRAIF